MAAAIVSTYRFLQSQEKCSVRRTRSSRIPVHKHPLLRRKSGNRIVSAVTVESPPKLSPQTATSGGDQSKILLEASVVVQKKNLLDLTDFVADLQDDLADLCGKKVRIQLVSESVDTETGKPQMSNEVPVLGWIWSVESFAANGLVRYKARFEVDHNFGRPGAILVKNEHPNEFILVAFRILQPEINFDCNSWISPSSAKEPRVFFADKICLPENTPLGLRELRKQEMRSMQGNGIGERVSSDDIYDYDVYNDLGNPDESKELSRPVLGGKKHPYPRRNRTGRPPTKTERESESKPRGLDDMYVPADEEFRRLKNSNFLGDAVKAVAHQLVPAIKRLIGSSSPSYNSFKELQGLYDEGIDLGKQVIPDKDEISKKKVSSPFTLINQLTDTDETNDSLLKYPLPPVIAADREAWMTDDEFARQTLAGLNPLMIKKLDSFPPKSNLDTAAYGTEATALKEMHIEPQLEGLTVQQALEQNKLFILDYHEVFLPYLNRINKQEGKKLYASRTIFFLTTKGTLKTVAIELSLPAPKEPGQRSNRVFVPPQSKKKDWLWELAKAHVAVNDCGFHQLVSHWLRTHAVMEPFILATHRQLSSIHPVHKLLLPHFKDTMSINAKARNQLINASGIIEDNFTTGKYSIVLSSVAYDLLWRFDQQGLPSDLISRGMATPNPQAKHGLELAIADYPYAVDGLDLWAVIKDWVEDFTNIFYKDDASIQRDEELQAWWKEIVNVGHGDKKDGWKEMNSKTNLVETLTTIIWIASAHHAAVNFGQYAYAGYPPNRPTTAHKLIPEEGSEEYKELQRNPEKYFLSTISNRSEITTVLTAIEILSTHSEEEHYLGEKLKRFWTSNEAVIEAFDKFSADIGALDQQIVAKNKNPDLHNRRGPVNLPYTLLRVPSTEGITGAGVPNSISI